MTILEQYNAWHVAEEHQQIIDHMQAEEQTDPDALWRVALAFADPVENFGIAIDFMVHSDFEYAITLRYFVEDVAAVCKGNNKKEVEKYMKEFL